MAATGLRLAFSFALAFLSLEDLRADEPGVVRSQLNDIATSLSAGNPAAAIEPFSKSFAAYDKLRDYFIGLTSAFTIVNEIDVTEEQDAPIESTATVRWSITLSSASDNYSNQRTAEIHIRSVKEKNKWKIIKFSPIDLFDPSEAHSSRGQQ
jgi:hypothetical protein